MKKILSTVGLLIVVVAGSFTGSFLNRDEEKPLAGFLGGSYKATTTDRTWPTAAVGTTTKTIKTGSGVLACITITGVGTGIVNLYDGTTTASHNLHATTTLVSAFPSLGAGDYCPNAAFSRGLIVETTNGAGVVPVVTVTYQ